MKFTDLDLIDPVLSALKDKGYEEPTPIQEKSIPLVLDREDLLGVAQTGTGKTAAFSIPIIQLIHEFDGSHHRDAPLRCLIVTPTRELAIQIDENIRDYSKYTKTSHTVIFGGVKQHSQVQALNLSRTILDNPKKVEVTPKSSTAETVKQYVYYTNRVTKHSLLVHILENEDIEQVLLFSRTKHGADRIVRNLKKSNIHSAAIHGNKSQNQRQKALKDFKDGRLRVLVATDIAARGIDISKLRYVINYDIPNVPETYVHRIGRSGRAGEEGIAMSISDRILHLEINKRGI